MDATQTTRQLGRSTLRVPLVCFGGNVFGWTLDEAASFAMLDRLREQRLLFIDTADVYSRWVPGNNGGESEIILGRWMKSRKCRGEVVLATKVGAEMGPGMQGLAPGYIASAVEASLRRLQTDYIDLYQSHFEDAQTPVEDTLKAFAKLVDDGKVRLIGASNYSVEGLEKADTVADASGLPRYQSLQAEYNLYERATFESGMAASCLKHNISVLTYFSLAAGFLSGKYRSAADLEQSARGNRTVKRFMTERGRNILAALDKVATDSGDAHASIALRWLIDRPGIASALVSATNDKQLAEIIAATTLKLSPEATALLDHASA